MGPKKAWIAIASFLTGRGQPADLPNSDADSMQAGDGVAAHGSDALADSPALPSSNALAPSASPVGVQPGRVEIVGDIEGNTIELGNGITLTGTIRGKGNIIRIAGSKTPQTLHLHMFGHNNHVTIGAGSLLQKLRVEIGSERWPCSRARLKIGKRFSIASHGRFVLSNSGNVLEIGDNCMFSSNIVIRGGEYPHLIFEMDSGNYLDVSDGIFIGDHTWVGEGAFIGKSVTLPDNSIVGTRSVVTKRFDETHCVIAGNPARIVKRGVQWVATEFVLETEFPAGHKLFSDTPINRINRAESRRMAPPASKEPSGSSTPAESD